MDKTSFDIPRLSNPPVMLSYLQIAYTYLALSAQREVSAEKQQGIGFRTGPTSATPGWPAPRP